MIVVNLKGGLGNQLFQIATGYAHSLKIGCEFAINYDLFTGCLQGKGPQSYRENIYRKIPTTSYTPKFKYNEVEFNYNQLPEQGDMLLDGYFQSEKYFKEYKNEIKQLFEFPEDIITKVGSALDGKIVGHVRRGDYKNLSHVHNLIDVDYYNQALKLINIDSKKIYLTTDSPVDVAIEFANKIDFVHINGKTELEDLYCLTKGYSIVGSNSSFAWWGAWLGNHHKKIFPSRWFGPSGPQNFTDIYCEDFMII